MTAQFKTISLMGNYGAFGVLESIHMLADHLPTLGVRVRVSTDVQLTELPDGVEQVAAAQLTESAELIIAIGGDGSMLTAAKAAATAGIPLVGINRGRLGFLADVNPSDKIESIDRILSGDFDSETRMLLHAEIIDGENTLDCGIALNDFVVKRHKVGRMLDFRTSIDGRYVNTHGGDGFIVATPTGSTAYALSCGGPIVAPNLDAIELAPICPHTLSDRPLMIPGTSITEIELSEDQSDKAEVSGDGEVAGYLEPGQKLRVAVADRRVELIHPSGYDYYEVLRGKLSWGRGNRGSLNGI
jgi:NAD+ kinase